MDGGSDRHNLLVETELARKAGHQLLVSDDTAELTQLSPTLTFPKKKQHMKPPSPSYFINYIDL